MSSSRGYRQRIEDWHPQGSKFTKEAFEEEVSYHLQKSRRLAERLAGRRILPDLSEAA